MTWYEFSGIPPKDTTVAPLSPEPPPALAEVPRLASASPRHFY